jgi:Flp pilus assembly protein TadG
MLSRIIMMRQVAKHLCVFRKDDPGVAATEFALILPILILLLFGTVEIGNALLLDKKVTMASQTAADLIAQQKVVTGADIVNIWAAIDNIILPYATDNTSYTVVSLVADEDGNQSIDWQQTRGGGVVEEITVPAGMLGTDESAIIATITYQYTPVFGDLLFSDFAISDVSYLRPRTVDAVDFQ